MCDSTAIKDQFLPVGISVTIALKYRKFPFRSNAGGSFQLKMITDELSAVPFPAVGEADGTESVVFGMIHVKYFIVHTYHLPLL